MADDLQELLGRARCVLFDFDGPMCRLFAGHPASAVAQELRDLLNTRGASGLLSPEEERSDDPYRVLSAVDRAAPGDPLVAEIEERLTDGELRAVDEATPTPYANELVRALVLAGRKVGVTTNNSPAAVERYLRAHGLDGHFAGHVYGRTGRPVLLKPHPDCVNRALAGMGAGPEEAVMIGDAAGDLMAATDAKVGFIGYARNERKAAQLRDARADVVVRSLRDVLTAGHWDAAGPPGA
ncbi:HAD family hydrolase [Streptomyces sp. NPDC059909]|uniref:HAD family hydrolase n=1 Tax=Streptomyces sp. NPDC059909 TaxID=3346998 RepID=UPI003654DE6E